MCSASTEAMASTAPAAPSIWPVIDLVELTSAFSAALPSAVLMAMVSALSFIGVLVPCALMYTLSSGVMPACSIASANARAAPSASGCGAVM